MLQGEEFLQEKAWRIYHRWSVEQKVKWNGKVQKENVREVDKIRKARKLVEGLNNNEVRMSITNIKTGEILKDLDEIF